MCCVSQDYSQVLEATHLKQVASPFVPQRSRSQYSPITAQHSRHLAQIHAWFGRFSHSSVRFARCPHNSISSFLTLFPPAWLLLHCRPHACFLTTPGHVAESPEEQHSRIPLTWLPSSLQTSQLLVASELPHGRLAFLSLPTLILNGDLKLPVTSNLTPPTISYFTNSPITFYILLTAIFSQC